MGREAKSRLTTDEMAARYQSGEPATKLARVAGIAPVTVYKHLRAAGVSIRSAKERAAIQPRQCRQCGSTEGPFVPRRQWCKDCQRKWQARYMVGWRRKQGPEYNRKRREREGADKERALAWKRAWYARNQEKLREQKRVWTAANRDKVIAHRAKARERKGYGGYLRDTYGLSLETYERIWNEQKGHCAICQTALTRGSRKCHLDHNHETGVVRGILCHHCNVGLGHFRDDPSLCEAAAAYLREAKHFAQVA